MSEGETSAGELVLLSILVIFGLIFLLKPATATFGAFTDFLDLLPDPSALGPYGSIIAAIALLTGSGGFLRRQL